MVVRGFPGEKTTSFYQPYCSVIHKHLRIRKHFPCFYRVSYGGQEREITWDTSTTSHCFQAISSFSVVFRSVCITQ